MSQVRVFVFGVFMFFLMTAETKNTINQSILATTTKNKIVKNQNNPKPTFISSNVKAKAVCQTTIYANDNMQYTDEKGVRVENITVPKLCQEYTLFMEYKGNLPSTVMGHNWILTEEKDITAVSSEAIKQGVAKGYLPLSEDSRVVAASTRLLGGGSNDHKKDKIIVDMKKIQETKNYVYWCSFPGHISMMRGSFTVQNDSTLSASKKIKTAKG